MKPRLPNARLALLEQVLVFASFALVMAKHKDHHGDDLGEMPTLLPITASDIFGISLAAIGIALAAGSGIGGGGILVPIYILVMGIDPAYAIPLSNATVLGGSFANTALYLFKRHPHQDKPLIDFTFAILMEPPTMAGAMVGAIVNKNTPVWIITMLLVIVLFLLTYRSFWQAFKRHDQENKAEAAAQQARIEAEEAGTAGEPSSDSNPLSTEEQGVAQASQVESTPNNAADSNKENERLLADDPRPSTASEEETAQTHGAELAAIMEKERHIPWCYMLLLPMIFSVVLVSNLVTKLSGLECGSTAYWVMEVLPLLIAFSMFALLAYRTNEMYNRKVLINYQFHEGDIQWTPTMTAIAATVCWMAGLFAGFFGVGGGLVKAPQMIEMGMLPEVVAATTAFMIIFTSASATVLFSVLGLLAWDYAGLLFVVGVVFTIGGQLAFEYLSKKYVKRSSYTVFLIAIVLGMSTVLLGYTGIKRTVTTFQEGKPNAMRGTCG